MSWGLGLVFAQEGDGLYARACDYCDEDAVIHVFAAQYYNIYRNNHRIEQIHLTEAEVSLHPILPLSFSICCRGLFA